MKHGCREVARARAAHLLPINAATMIQNAWRTRIARAVFRVRIHHRLYEYQVRVGRDRVLKIGVKDATVC